MRGVVCVCACVCLCKPVLPYCSFCTRQREQQSVILINAAVAGRRTDPKVHPSADNFVAACPHFCRLLHLSRRDWRSWPWNYISSPFRSTYRGYDLSVLINITGSWRLQGGGGGSSSYSIFNSSGSFLIDGRWDALLFSLWLLHERHPNQAHSNSECKRDHVRHTGTAEDLRGGGRVTSWMLLQLKQQAWSRINKGEEIMVLFMMSGFVSVLHFIFTTSQITARAVGGQPMLKQASTNRCNFPTVLFSPLQGLYENYKGWCFFPLLKML